MDAKEKDDIFRNPPPPELCLGRNISAWTGENTLWAVIQAEKKKSTHLLACAYDLAGEAKPAYFYSRDEGVQQPFIFQAPGKDTDKPAVVWNEFRENKWHVKYAEIDTAGKKFQESETIFSSPDLCLPPAATVFQQEPAVVWSGKKDNELTVFIAFRKDGIWEIDTPFRESGIDCFRPAVTVAEDKCILFWDEYRDKRYQITISERGEDGWREKRSRGEENERWLNPQAVTAPDGSVYVTWTVLRDVYDKLGIVDHFPFAMAARWQDGQLQILEDEGNEEDSRIIADLREGLLAKNIYKGHVGLRLNPRLAVNRNSDLMLLWERKIEKEDSDITSWLCGRNHLGDNKWSSPVSYSKNGYCYAVPSFIHQHKSIPAAFLQYRNEGENILQAENIKASGTEFSFQAEAWKRWLPYIPEPKDKNDRTSVSLKGDELQLFWADTHCHSNFSPDAEGELDELVNFAKNIAGLDAVTIIDNDYYPHKSLTPPEWQAQQELADHFTEEGRFVYMPGYEYTYHRADLEPDFNHRCVIYPRKGGPLLRRIDPDSNNDSKMLTCLTETDGMAYPHHCSFKLVEEKKEWNVEACSSWRLCIEETDFLIRQLLAGWKIGFIGSSDTHRGVPGLGGARTGLFAPELTPEALFEAYSKRRCIATQGFNIGIDFRVNDYFIGDSGKTFDPPLIRACVRAPKEMDYVEIIRDGEVISWDSPQGTEFEVSHQDKECPAGEHFYFLKVKLVGDPSFNIECRHPTENLKPFEQNSRYPHNLSRAQGPFAWTSPVWLERKK